MRHCPVKQYYLLSFLSATFGMQVISAIYVTFLMKHGLNLFEVNLVNAIYFTTLFLCEIPTGAFADTFGRKASYVASKVFVSISMLLYGLSETFWGFVGAEMIAAFGATFGTGAFQSWLVDTLKHRGYQGSYHQIFARASLYNQLGAGLGALGGAYLAASHLAWPWFIGSAGLAIVGLLGQLLMKEEYFVKQKLSWSTGVASMKATARSSIRYGMMDKSVRFILVVTFVQIYAVQAINMYWQPLFRERGVADQHLGLVYIGMMVFLALGSFLAMKIKGRGLERRAILWAMLYVGVTVMIASVSTALPLALGFFFIHELGRGFWGPMADSYLHQRVPSRERATITSFCAIAPHIGGAIGLLVSGGIAQIFGITTAWMTAGGVLTVGALLVYKNGGPSQSQT